jgi:hypothetical protein
MEEAKMARIRRPGFSDFEKAEIWRGWKRGMTLNSIGRALDRAGPHVRDLVAASGGIAPPPRRRSSWVLSRLEREEISRGIAADDSARNRDSAARAGSADLENDTLAAMQRSIEAREYQASRNDRGLQAPNRKHGLRAYFEPTGIRVHDRTAEGSPELLTLRWTGVGRGASLAAVPAGEMKSFHLARIGRRIREGWDGPEMPRAFKALQLQRFGSRMF